MHTLKLSPDGHLVIPEAVRNSHHWQAGIELMMVEVGDGILLRPKKTVKETTLEEVAGCLHYSGAPKSLDDMDAAIAVGMQERNK
jgi:bifunctional DNA-binding transcriptional regulator/antitoxin component of YhaV-PrlF toxin-antitoxin module